MKLNFGKQMVSPSTSYIEPVRVYNSSGQLEAVKIWVGKVSTSANGSFNCSFSGVTFTTTPVISAVIEDTGRTGTSNSDQKPILANLYQVTTSGYKGYVRKSYSTGIGIIVSAVNLEAGWENVTVHITAIGT